MDIAYSGSHTAATRRRKDVRRIHPRLFNGVEKDATRVFLMGNLPNIRSAYERAGISVHDISELELNAPSKGATKSTDADGSADNGKGAS